MTSRFQCPECGELLATADGRPGSVLCPRCGIKATSPAALSGLPRPQPPLRRIPVEHPPEPPRRIEVLPAMARAMPWLFSAFFHLGLAMIFIFIAMVTTIRRPPPTGPAVDFSFSDPPPAVTTGLPARRPRNDLKLPRKEGGREAGAPERDIRSDLDRNAGDPMKIIGGAKVGLEDTDDVRKTGVAFLGIKAGLSDGRGEDGDGDGRERGPGPGPIDGGGVADIVYLIDRSGSMIDSFKRVREELVFSVARLDPRHRFHVILFADGRPLEKRPRAMTPATATHKIALVDFLEPVRSCRQTDPIPAINRAFDVLGGTGGRRGKVIFMLTDGVFPDNELVLATIRGRNARRDVAINTILYGYRPPEAERVMRRIAEENFGQYRYVSPDE